MKKDRLTLNFLIEGDYGRLTVNPEYLPEDEKVVEERSTILPEPKSSDRRPDFRRYAEYHDFVPGIEASLPRGDRD